MKAVIERKSNNGTRETSTAENSTVPSYRGTRVEEKNTFIPRTPEDNDEAFLRQGAGDIFSDGLVNGARNLDSGIPEYKLAKGQYQDQMLSHHSSSPQKSNEFQVESGLYKMAGSQRIHVLGSGPYGKYVAHCLAGLANAPPVTLILQDPSLIQNWESEGRVISVVRRGKILSEREVEVEPAIAHNEEEPGKDIIDYLVVTTQGIWTVSMLSIIKGRLRSSSVVCFLRDGLGVVDVVNSTIFPDISARPSFILGTITHDLRSTSKEYTVVERSTGATKLTMLHPLLTTRGETDDGHQRQNIVRRVGWADGPRYLMRTITRSPILNASGELVGKYLASELRRLVINSVIWPLSTVLNTPPGLLLHNYHAKVMVRDLLEELSIVIRSLPELSEMQKKDKIFGVDQLMHVIQTSIAQTHGRGLYIPKSVKIWLKYHIDYWNGYFLRRGAELGIRSLKNEHLVRLVKTKLAVKGFETDLHIPFGQGKR
ncbi:hypothetical protein F5884DRAFT_483388 [Xylogone sp. PMI_703]|nr:hypothetical protein F5884DRAFT_483388 [Xylogone sp. PMI_703]